MQMLNKVIIIEDDNKVQCDSVEEVVKTLIDEKYYELDEKEKLEKRAINWKNRLKQCDLESEILEKTEIILLIKSFTIPEFARKESVDYDDSIIKIRRSSVKNK